MAAMRMKFLRDVRRGTIKAGDVFMISEPACFGFIERGEAVEENDEPVPESAAGIDEEVTEQRAGDEQ